MATKLHVVTGDQYRIIDRRIREIKRQLDQIDRRIREIKRQLDQEDSSPLDPDVVAPKPCNKSWKAVSVVKVKFLKLVSGGKCLIIDPVDGSELLAKATDVFAYIDPDFQNWGADEPGPSTEQTKVCIYEMAKDATFAQMFGSLAPDAGKLCLTQAQIKQFVVKHRNWLRSDRSATFFLFKSHDHFFVASVRFGSDGGFEVNVNRFVRSGVWSAEYRLRVVVPQLA